MKSHLASLDEQEETRRAPARPSPGKCSLTAAYGGMQAATAPHPAVAAFAEKSDGAPLPSTLGARFGDAYGADFGGVRVHTDGAAAAAAAGSGAEAFTCGSDIFFAAGSYQPETRHGAFVLGHELAHVAQQEGQPVSVQALLAADAPGATAAGTEAEASQAAEIALAGGQVRLGRAAPGIHFLKQGSGSEADGGHAYMTERVLSQEMGVSATPARGEVASAARRARMGNWERDFSNLLIPSVGGIDLRPAVDVILPVLNIIALKEFGRPFQLSEIGTYDPVEHLDNPAGLTGQSVYAQGEMFRVGSDDDISQFESRTGRTPGAAGRADQSYSRLDQRYRDTEIGNVALSGGEGIGNRAYDVDESGIPRYLQTSRQLIINQLQQAGRLGRNSTTAGRPRTETETGDREQRELDARRADPERGPRLFSSAVHVLQDYYAHTNFLQVAINLLIREGALGDLGVTGEESGLLDTQVHGHSDGRDEAANLTITGAGRNDSGEAVRGPREVIMSGTFGTGEDTIASIMEEMIDGWRTLNPFHRDRREPSELVGACLDYLESQTETAAGIESLGAEMADLVRGAIGAIPAIVERVDAASHRVASGLEAAGATGGGLAERAGTGLAGLVRRGGDALHSASGSAGRGVGYLLRGAGDLVAEASGHPEAAASSRALAGNLERGAEGVGQVVAERSQSAAGEVQSAGEVAHDALGAAGQAVSSATRALGDSAGQGISSLAPHLEQIAARWEQRDHILRDAHQWLFENTNPMTLLIQQVRQIRPYGPAIADELEGRTNRIREALEQRLGAMWNRAIDLGERELRAFVDTRLRPATHLNRADPSLRHEGDMPASYTPDSHTELAHDHRTQTQGARDGVDDAPGEPPARHEVPEEIGGENQHALRSDDPRPNDRHGSVREGQFLTDLAERIADIATSAVGQLVNGVWDQPPPSFGAFDQAIVDEVGRYFAHPADRRYWRGPTLAALQGPLGRQVSERLHTRFVGRPRAR